LYRPDVLGQNRAIETARNLISEIAIARHHCDAAPSVF
jgi:hypothetical protein